MDHVGDYLQSCGAWSGVGFALGFLTCWLICRFTHPRKGNR